MDGKVWREELWVWLRRGEERGGRLCEVEGLLCCAC